MPFDTDQIRRFPTGPGVYLMKNCVGKVIYVGKAKNLRVRVRQYFAGGDGRAIIPLLIPQIEEIDTILVTSEKEALLLENNLIKKHKPKYNALLKDDKTYFSLAVNHKHQWPMVRVVRYKGKPPAGELYFGPYTQGYAAKQTLEMLRHLFPLRQCSDRELVTRTRPCMLYELKRCIAPCTAKCTKADYDALVKQLIAFLKGNDANVVEELRNEMLKAAERLDFERAEGILQTIRHIEATMERQKVETVGAGDFDVMGLFRVGVDAVVTQMMVRDGKLIGSEDHIFRHNAQEDTSLLCSFLIQQEDLAKEVVVPLSLGSAVQNVLGVHLTVPKRGSKKQLLELAEKNARARFEREKDVKEQTLIAMQERFGLVNYPQRIECFDNSNLGGTEPVSALVVYSGGRRDPKHYRKYRIQKAGPSDDYGALREVLTRRYTRAREEDNLPDLLIIDGGKGHLNVALDTLSELDVSTVDVIGVAKEEHKHTKGITQEQVFLRGESDPLLLPRNSPLLFFLQEIRDEAHRAAITFQKQRRKKRTFASTLDTLPGIGPVKKTRLLKQFGSLKRILKASDEELLAVKGITRKDVDVLKYRQEEKPEQEEQSDQPSEQ